LRCRSSMRSGLAEPFEADFEAAWALYPRKEYRKLALRAYQARRREGVAAEDLLIAVKAYAAAKKGSRFIHHGKTFFGPTEVWLEWFNRARPAQPERRYRIDG